MFLFVSDSDGKSSIRPMYIGFIRNNLLRRILLCLFTPITLIVTIMFNLVTASLKTLLVFGVSVYQAVYYPLSNLHKIQDTEIWKRPRTKADKHNRRT